MIMRNFKPSKSNGSSTVWEPVQMTVDRSLAEGSRDWEAYETHDRYIIYELEYIVRQGDGMKLRNLSDRAIAYIRKENIKDGRL